VEDSSDSGSRNESNVDEDMKQNKPCDLDVKREEENPEGTVDSVEKEGMKEDCRYTMHWFNAVARVAFGGLVPQAGKFVINAILFTVTGDGRKDCEDEGKPLGGTQTPSDVLECPGCFPQDHPDNSCSPLTKVLQRLVNALHTDCPEFKLFGDFVHRRVHRKLKWLDTDCSIPSTPRHAGALFSRYMTTLERLVAKSLFQKQQSEVRKGHVKFWEFAKFTIIPIVEWADAVVRLMQTDVTPKPANEAAEEADRYVEEIYEKCAELLFHDFGDTGNVFKLVAEVNQVIDKIENVKRPDRRITVEDCANVARCIIAVWALRVPVFDLKWEASGSSESGTTAAFFDLPSVLAFG
jgi:hypothetical protein